MTDQARGELVPGGLALVFGIIKKPHLNGSIVVTLREAKRGDEFRGCVYGADGGWLCTNDSFDEGHEYFLPFNLMPIKPEADPISIDQRQECEA